VTPALPGEAQKSHPLSKESPGNSVSYSYDAAGHVASPALPNILVTMTATILK